MAEAPPEEQSTVDNTLNGNVSELGPLEVRRTVGTGMEKFTKVVNDNLIAARYGIFAGVTLLTVYGMSQTPLFFRYRTIADVPTSYFMARRRLHGRIIGVDAVGRGDIRILVRHLSPIGQILPKSWFDFLVKLSPHASRIGSGTATNRLEENSRDLLKIKIAGIHGPPVPHLLYQTEEHLKRLASERALVSCQLLARQVVSSVRTDDGSNSKKRPMLTVMPELAQEDAYKTTELQQSSLQIPEVAICRVTYRPSFFQLFSTDVAQSLVSSGNASVSSSLVGQQESASQVAAIRDSSQRLDDLRNDLKYLDRLTKAEFEAAAKSLGMWSVLEVREAKRDVMDEVEFQTKASAIQKLWRWIRGG